MNLERRKVVINTASKSCDKILKIYTAQYDKFSEDLKKMINVLYKTEMLIFDLAPIPALLKGDEEVKLELEETIAERIKLNPRKRKNAGIGLKIWTPNKLLTRLAILLAQIKIGNN